MSTTGGSHVASILDAINATAAVSEAESPQNRAKLLSLSRQLTAALESPSEFIQRIGYAEPAKMAITRFGIDLGIFEMLRASREPLSSAQIAEATSAETGLIARSMKHLVAMHVVAEEGPDRYRATHLSDALALPKYRDGIVFTNDVMGPSLRNLPQYLKATNYRNPTDSSNSPFQSGHKTELPVFTWLSSEHPELYTAFNNYMGGYRQGKISWMEPGFFPVESLYRDVQARDVLLVDVGGGLGHDLKELKAKHPQLPGRLILQDLPQVVAQIQGAIDGIETMAHDFFTEQSVKGAKAYYFHSVFHNWDDEACSKILHNLRPAMRASYSKVLINDFVVPDVGAEWPATSMDWIMMAFNAVRERTEAEWHRLVESAGLRIGKIWSYDQSTESLIEIELDE